MTLYTPPDKNQKDKGDAAKNVDSSNEPLKLYPRPSLGLKMWGPLVPASDNRVGLWSLVGAQTLIGLFFLRRGWTIRKNVNMRNLATGVSPAFKTDISNIPTLNRFSNGPVATGTATTKPSIFASILTRFIKRQPTGSRFGARYGYQNQQSWQGFRSFASLLYLFVGALVISQSTLEIMRLVLLKYDPWYDEAKSAREKKFFNDIVKYYHEGIDPTKIKVKDASSGTALSTNSPQVRQSVALVRAQAENESILTKWFGPVYFKPMSFNDFLDKLEYNLDIQDKIDDKKKSKLISKSIQRKLRHTPDELHNLKVINEENRKKTLQLLDLNRGIGESDHQGQKSEHPPRGIIMDDALTSPEEVDLGEMWYLYNPWMNLALDTSLSIKFLPTVVMDTDDKDSKSDGNDQKNY
ncbi:hypothetical protein TPHA_0E03800 [Tetrapisispora phaffii CBS 4417]|uniref:Mitochondrial inner membrane i-AAA protease complex subunit MGR1 n=1 Tax=Tetrapisispora phaffii (strain ATCC 24235 / CBS 4417 / NBRC 1672 / NRRL Y-8282 / UCD 70-5) TaxID=1071381 RepID=G8BU91_TETPH|nr:hypothetical protein TPHA_0E03800 [Tetrapisispora phaffii CBS 4417]CCE63469.1 hypothetical protein TPHA_0E03800 [Tetrapisispora phaffii CBS 4417]